MPLTDAQKQRRAADKKASSGLVRICGWGTPEQREQVRLYLSGQSEIVKNCKDCVNNRPF